MNSIDRGMLLSVSSSSSIAEERQNRGRVAGQTEVKLRWQPRQLVNVHFRELVLCRSLFRSCRCGFVWVAWLALCSLLPVDWPVLCLLLLRWLHFGLGFGQHRVAGCIKLLNREEEEGQNRDLFLQRPCFYLKLRWFLKPICKIKTWSFISHIFAPTTTLLPELVMVVIVCVGLAVVLPLAVWCQPFLLLCKKTRITISRLYATAAANQSGCSLHPHLSNISSLHHFILLDVCVTFS